MQNINNKTRFEINSTSNKLNSKSISLTSTISKANTNTSSQKELSDTNKKIKRCYSSKNYTLFKSMKSKKNNLYINTFIFTENIKKEKKSYYNPSYNKYKRANSNDLLFNKFKEIKLFQKNNNYNTKNKTHKKKIILRNNNFRSTKSKNDLNAFSVYNNEAINILLNHYPNIEKHRKIKFNQEIKHEVKSMNKEKNQNNNLMFCYNQKKLVTPYKLLYKNQLNDFRYSIPYLNDENIYKYNIMAKSRILSINDIQKKNIDTFFNTEKFDNIKRSSSLESLRRIIHSSSPKYISDCFCNKSLYRPRMKIYNYKSKKLREIYDELV